MISCQKRREERGERRKERGERRKEKGEGGGKWTWVVLELAFSA